MVTAVETKSALNNFQRLMRSWERLGAYNAIHYLSGQHLGDKATWQQAIDRVVSQTPWLQTFPKLSPLLAIRGDLSVCVQQALNRPFADQEAPLVFMHLQQGDDYHLICVYRHYIADSVTIRGLLQRIVTVYQQFDADVIAQTTVRSEEHQLYSEKSSLRHTLRALLYSVKPLIQFSRAYRLRIKPDEDFTSACIIKHFPSAVVQDLKKFAKKRQVSVNDVFLTAMATTLGRFIEQKKLTRKKSSRRRKQIGLGVIADLRPFAACDLADSAGMYLSSYMLRLPLCRLNEPDALLTQIHQKTALDKRKQTVKKNFKLFTAVLRFLRWFNPSHRDKASFFNRHTPMVAGVSNVNADNTALYDCHFGDYGRISPVGPLLPLVYCLTTFKNRLSLAMTYRQVAFTEQEAQQLAEHFAKALHHLVEGESASD